MLRVDGLGKDFAGITALRDVSFEVRKGSITSLIGPNGAGKTTVLNIVTGIFPPSTGTISFQGHSLTGKRADAVASMGIRRTFQTVHLFSGLTVRENLAIGAFRRLKDRRPISLLLPMRYGNAASNRKANEVLQSLGLTHHVDRLAADLPYGMQRRVEIARALMGEPSFVLFDEPAAGMNEAETRELMTLIRRIRDQGITVFLVEHDMNLVMSISDNVIVLNFGRKITEGTPAEVQCNPEVINSYLGSAPVRTA